MGNRCVITPAPYGDNNPAVYLHWNGGIESVLAFCQVARELGYRSPHAEGNPDYGLARLTGLICLYFDITGDTSIGIGRAADFGDPGDNGIWLIGPDWEIVGRLPSSDSKRATKPPKNEEPAKTALIYKQLIVGARLCKTAFEESNKTLTVGA